MKIPQSPSNLNQKKYNDVEDEIGRSVGVDIDDVGHVENEVEVSFSQLSTHNSPVDFLTDLQSSLKRLFLVFGASSEASCS
jgi:hypothetical protein